MTSAPKQRDSVLLTEISRRNAIVLIDVDVMQQSAAVPLCRGGGNRCTSLGRRKGVEGPGTTEFRTWGDEFPT